jgi:lactoylglutathione lyase
MANPSLQLIVLRAAEIDRTVRFYEALGLQFTQEQHGSGPVHYACELGGIVLEIYPAKQEHAFRGATGSMMMLGFQVDSLPSVLEALAGLGVSAPAEHSTTSRALVEDPDGRAVEIRQGG